MSLITLNGLSDVREAQLAKEGLYHVQCIKVQPPKDDKNGAKMINTIYHIESEEPDVEYANVFDMISIPGPNDDKDRVTFKLLMIKRRLYWLGLTDAISSGELNTEDFVGCRSGVPVKIVQDEYLGTYKNLISWPKLPDEE